MTIEAITSAALALPESSRAINRAFDRIEQWPQSCAKVHRVARICRIKRFPFGIVYVVREDEFVVVAVMHLHRRPGYWKRRLKRSRLFSAQEAGAV